MADAEDSAVGDNERRPAPANHGTDSAADHATAIAFLRTMGAERLDPVRFRFIEALARRGREHRGETGRILDRRLRAALATYRERFERTQDETGQLIARFTARHPETADDLRRLFDAGDFGGVNRFVARLDEKDRQVSVADLTRYLAQRLPEIDGAGLATGGGSRPELKTMRHFRRTWSRLRAATQVAKALARAPGNAGPLNSQQLVLQSLALMRDIAPDYLGHFVSYAEALLWLDRAGNKNRAAGKKTPLTKTVRK